VDVLSAEWDRILFLHEVEGLKEFPLMGIALTGSVEQVPVKTATTQTLALLASVFG
jgi:hypothetical protein